MQRYTQYHLLTQIHTGGADNKDKFRLLTNLVVSPTHLYYHKLQTASCLMLQRDALWLTIKHGANAVWFTNYVNAVSCPSNWFSVIGQLDKETDNITDHVLLR